MCHSSADHNCHYSNFSLLTLLVCQYDHSPRSQDNLLKNKSGQLLACNSLIRLRIKSRLLIFLFKIFLD